MHRRRIFIPIILLVIVSLVVYWYLAIRETSPAESALTGSGTVEATTVTVSPEMFGRVAEVLVNEGDKVNAGDILLKLDATLLTAQLNQADINLSAAQAGMDVARDAFAAAVSGMSVAHAQYDLTLAQALQQAQPSRTLTWIGASPGEFEQPLWYYTHTEQLAAALEELDLARAALDSEQASFTALKSSGAYAELDQAEARLAHARMAYLNAQQVLTRAEQQDDQALIDAAQQAYDESSAELEAAQSDYRERLSDEQADEILAARARVAISQEHFDTARDQYNALQSGADSPQVQVASASLAQAEANVSLAESKVRQAQIAVDQAQAAYDLISTQMQKLTILAPVAGVVLSRNIQPGEVIQPGASALTLGILDQLTITVYIPEDRYGEVSLGDHARVSVDSFPEQSFTATVTHIADQAEFTPRNVQTVEGRSTTVYAIRLEVEDPGGMLKPGMPADVTFDRP